jgi:hypothetical protein
MPKRAAAAAAAAARGPAIIAVHSEDKAFDTSPPQDSLASMPRGSRIAVIADPGRGKTAAIKCMLCASAPWAGVYVIHGAVGSTEYDLVQHTALDWITATPEFFAAESAKHGKKPCALIVDDCAYSDLSKTGKSNAYACLQHACTHHNFTAWLASHSLTQLVPRLRRACDVMCIWPPTTGGSDQVPYLARALGLPRPALQEAFDVARSRGKHSFLCIYQDPPAGRSRIMLDCDTPIELE